MSYSFKRRKKELQLLFNEFMIRKKCVYIGKSDVLVYKYSNTYLRTTKIRSCKTKHIHGL